MYKVASYYPSEQLASGHMPTCMYKVENYHGSSHEKSDNVLQDQTNLSGSQQVEALLAQHRIQLNRLRQLTRKLNDLCVDLNLSHLIVNDDTQSTSTTTASSSKVAPIDEKLIKGLIESNKNLIKTVKANKGKTLEDVVIHLDANTSFPYALFALIVHRYAVNYKCFVQFHHHHNSSGAESKKSLYHDKIERLEQVFKQLNLTLSGEPRSAFDFGFTFIWKDVNGQFKEPSLVLNNRGVLYGESAILRHLTRLLPSSHNHYESNKPEKWILIDEAMNKCTNGLVRSSTGSYVKSLEADLGKSTKSLVSTWDKPTVADLYIWSSLEQQQQNKDVATIKKSKTYQSWASGVSKEFALLAAI